MQLTERRESDEVMEDDAGSRGVVAAIHKFGDDGVGERLVTLGKLRPAGLGRGREGGRERGGGEVSERKGMGGREGGREGRCTLFKAPMGLLKSR